MEPMESHRNPKLLNKQKNEDGAHGWWFPLVLSIYLYRVYCCLNMSTCCRNQYSRNQAPCSESWRTQVYYSSGPRGVNLQALSPEQRAYRAFIHGQAWLSRFAGLQGMGDCKEQDNGEWDKLQFLVFWVPTLWDLHDLDFARSKLSYRDRRRRR